MMRKNLTLLAIIFSLILIASGAFAMVPRVKFPEWNHTSIKITDWDPIKGIVTITVEIEANKIPIEKCYSQPYLQSNFNKLLSKYEKDNIKQGEKAVFGRESAAVRQRYPARVLRRKRYFLDPGSRLQGRRIRQRLQRHLHFLYQNGRILK